MTYTEAHARYMRTKRTLIEVIRDTTAKPAVIEFWLAEIRQAEKDLNAAFYAASAK